MKPNLLLFAHFCLANSLFGQAPMVTEIGYDNNYDQNDPFGIDSIEYVEVYLPDPQPTNLTSINVVAYNPVQSDPTTASVHQIRDLTDTLRTWKTPNGKYYVVEFPDGMMFGFPSAGLYDGTSGVALVQLGSPNFVHQFWRYETCDDFTAIDGPAIGAVSDPITTDFSRVCGSSGVFLVQMNSALNTDRSIQQNGFGDWYLDYYTSYLPPLENQNNVPVNLTAFDVAARGDNALLTWSTAQEFSNDYFSILHARDGRSFTEIGKVKGSGFYNGERNYDFITDNLSSGDHYFKLKQVDLDGNYEVFPVKTVKIIGEPIGLYPSPVTSEITLTNVKAGSTFQLFDMKGQLMKEDIYDSTINVEGLRTGIYLIKVNNTVLRFNKI